MSASRASLARLRGLALTFFLFLALVGLGGAQVEPAAPAPAASDLSDELFPLEAPALSSLARLQAEWLDWLVACNEGNQEQADASIQSLLSYARLLGMESVPSLSQAAAWRAIEFSDAGDHERARWALEAAERLHPGQPESSFAAARLARAEGAHVGVFTRSAGGYWRMLRTPHLRYVFLNNLAIWVAMVIVVTGLLLIAVLMISRGPELYFDCHRYLNRYAPSWLAHAVSLVLLVWPFLLPAGVLWTAFYWSVLLWAYGGKVEKVALLVFWLFVGTLPAVVGTQSRWVGLSLFPPMQSIESASRGELQGELFTHLALMSSILPDSPALMHLNADVHRKLNQMESARALYERVLGDDTENAAGLNELGIYYFEVSDFERAARYFEQAGELDELQAPVFFNLSQAYSELYRFNESEDALIQARSLNGEAVNRWLQAAEVEKVIPLDGGLQRVDEIRSELKAQWRLGEELPSWVGQWGRAVSLPLVAVFVGIAAAVRLLTRRGRRARKSNTWWESRADSVRRVLLAGVIEAETGKSGQAILWLTGLVAILSIPFVGRGGYALPWLHQPSPFFLPALSGVLLLIFFLARFWAQNRSAE